MAQFLPTAMTAMPGIILQEVQALVDTVPEEEVEEQSMVLLIQLL